MPVLHPAKRRITPAYAGKRDLLIAHPPCTQDHPRLRGEKEKILKAIVGIAGSPPLTRGKGSRKAEFPIGDRITPAYAGKSFPLDSYLLYIRDHPRLRGEKKSGGFIF